MNGYCELFIYRNSKILKNKNFKVDDIEQYLATLDCWNKTSDGQKLAIKGQFMKHQYKLFYNLELSQTTFDGTSYSAQDLLYFKEDFNINYLSATNCNIDGSSTSKDKKVYYFIVGKKWLSESSIQFELEMDVINTMIDNYSSQYEEHLELSPKTTILRQHKDRWKKSVEPNKMYVPVIDLYSEGITPPLFKKSEANCYSYNIQDDSLDEQSYYLVYLASEEGQNKPVDIYLCADETLIVNQDWTYWSGTFNARAELRSKYGAIIYGNDGASGLSNIGCTISFNYDRQRRTFSITSANQAILITNGSIMWGTVSANGWVNNSGILNLKIADSKKIEITGLAKMRICGRTEITRGGNPISAFTDTYLLSLPVASEYAPSQEENAECINITDIDRTNGRVAKVVKLPYCPIDVIKNNDGTISLPSDWEVSSWPLEVISTKAIHYRFKNFPECFTSEHWLDNEDYTLEAPYSKLALSKINDFGEVVAKNKIYETKLLHSDYYLQKFVYDSFAFNFRCEFMADALQGMQFKIKMATSSAMTSNFFFDFTDNMLKIDTEDYSNIMMVSRNNEVILYNSSYLDYIRNGYNYDKKTRNRNLALSIASLTLGTAGDVIGLVAGSGEKTKGQNIASAVQLGLKTAGSIIKMAGQTAQADQNIVQKLRTSLYQGVSVAGSDDLDLMSEYTKDNKAKLVEYYVSEKMEKSMFDLFYYTGYIANFQGVPDTSSRMWFNFVMAEPVYENEQNFSQKLLEVLSEKYAEGITFLHKVITYENEQPVNNWDFEQQYENWETSILPIARIFLVSVSSQCDKNKEYVIKSDLSSIISDGNIGAYNLEKLTWRKRRKSDLAIIEERTGLDLLYINGQSSAKKMEILDGLSVVKRVYLATYAEADYYWTIEFSENMSQGYNIEVIFSALMGYIEYV